MSVVTFKCDIRMSDDLETWHPFPATVEQDSHGTIRITPDAPLPPMRYIAIDTSTQVRAS